MKEEMKGYGWNGNGFNRREFLKTGLLLTLSGKVIYDTCDKIYSKHLIHKIYNELPCHIHDIEIESITEDKSINTRGRGIVVNRKFITLYHVIDESKYKVNSPFGIMEMKRKILERIVKIGDTQLKELYTNKQKDIAIFETDLPDFPAKPSTKYKLGDEAYILGNPRNTGLNIRKGYISDLDRFGTYSLDNITSGCFGMSVPVTYGDSGSPVVNKDYKLIGLCRSRIGALAYITKIENFLEAM
ncbi:MAG: S1 family peptidase [Candidatus Heimdallarchaeaceae archaeon]